MHVSGHNIAAANEAGQVMVRDQAKSGEKPGLVNESCAEIETHGMTSPGEHIDEATISKSREECIDPTIILQGKQLKTLYMNSLALKQIMQQLRVALPVLAEPPVHRTPYMAFTPQADHFQKSNDRHVRSQTVTEPTVG